MTTLSLNAINGNNFNVFATVTKPLEDAHLVLQTLRKSISKHREVMEKINNSVSNAASMVRMTTRALSALPMLQLTNTMKNLMSLPPVTPLFDALPTSQLTAFINSVHQRNLDLNKSFLLAKSNHHLKVNSINGIINHEKDFSLTPNSLLEIPIELDNIHSYSNDGENFWGSSFNRINHLPESEANALVGLTEPRLLRIAKECLLQSKVIMTTILAGLVLNMLLN